MEGEDKTILIESSVGTTRNTGKQEKPELRLKSGTIELTVWNNRTKTKEGIEKEYKTIRITRNYKTRDGTWKSTTSFRIRDLPQAIALLTRAYEKHTVKEL